MSVIFLSFISTNQYFDLIEKTTSAFNFTFHSFPLPQAKPEKGQNKCHNI